MLMFVGQQTLAPKLKSQVSSNCCLYIMLSQSGGGGEGVGEFLE